MQVSLFFMQPVDNPEDPSKNKPEFCEQTVSHNPHGEVGTTLHPEAREGERMLIFQVSSLALPSPGSPIAQHPYGGGEEQM